MEDAIEFYPGKNKKTNQKFYRTDPVILIKQFKSYFFTNLEALEFWKLLWE